MTNNNMTNNEKSAEPGARQVVQDLLDCCELNLDELEENTRQAIERAQTFLAELPATGEGECVLGLPVYYDPGVTDPEALAYAFDRLLETAMSTPGILDDYANPTIGATFLSAL